MAIINSILTGIDTSDATAVANNIEEGKTAYVDGEKIVGTLVYDKPGLSIAEYTLLSSDSFQSADSWQSICYGNGKFITIAYGNNIVAYSTDGITWNTATLPSDEYWNSVCYGNGKFVAVEMFNDVVAYSTDGITWDTATLPSSAFWNSVCYGNGKFVAVADNSNEAAYSSDGITWTATTLSSKEGWRSVCYGNGKFVAVADNSNIATYSTDGITWTASTLPNTARWQSVCYGDGKFVAVAYDTNQAAYSTDGITWHTATLSSSAFWHSICYGNGKFVAVAGGSSTATYSSDGITWTNITLPSSREYVSACYGGETLAIVACSSNIVTIIETSWGTAQPSDVLEDTTFTSKEGITISGTITNCGEVSQTLNAGGSYTIPAGYHNGSGKVTANSLANQTSGTATDNNIEEGKTAWVNGTKITGTMTNQGAVSQLLNAGGIYTIPAGYHNGSGTITARSLAEQTSGTATADNIEEGKIAYVDGDKITGTLVYDKPGLISEDTLMPNMTKWNSICYGNGIFVATSGDGNPAYSEDGVNWTLSNSGAKLGPICYGNGKFVAVSASYSNKGAYSTDGITWNETTLPSSNKYSSICYDNGIFITATPGKIAAYSTDGINWDTITFTEFGSWYPYCGGGNYFSINNGSNVIMRSTDAINWSKCTISNNIEFTSICYGNGKFVATTSGNSIAYSDDGINWIEVTLSNDIRFSSVCYGNNEYLAVSSNKNMTALSVDGITWNTINLGNNPPYFSSVCYGNGKYAAIASGYNTGTVIKYSWGTAKTSDVLKGTTFTSSNGISLIGTLDLPRPGISTSEESTIIDGVGWNYVCYGDGKFVAVPGTKNDYKVAYSTDGINWTTTDSNLSGTARYTLDSVCYGDGKFVAIDGRHAICSEDGGITWSRSNICNDENISWKSVCYGNGYFVAVAEHGKSSSDSVNYVAYSSSGTYWETSSIPESIKCNAVCYGNGKFVAIAYNSDIAIYSSNGYTWNKSYMPSSAKWNILCYGDGKFIAMPYSGNKAAYSNDGINWTEIQLPISDKWASICYSDYGFIAIAGNYYNRSGRAIFSTDGITWHIIDIPVKYWTCVCYGDSKFVATACNSTAGDTNVAVLNPSKPPDYTDWGNATPDDVFEGVTFTSREGYTLKGTVRIEPVMVDIDTWSEVTLPSGTGDPKYGTVIYENGVFIACGSSNKIARSVDGISWEFITEHQPVVSNIFIDICYGNGKFIGVDDFGVLWISTDNGNTWTYVNMSSESASISPLADIHPGPIVVTDPEPTISAICFGNGKFVSITNSDTAMYSTDGINWSKTTMPSSQKWCSVCWGDRNIGTRYFIAVSESSNTIAYSEDGITWSELTLPTDQTHWNYVCYGDGIYVAVSGTNSNTSVYSYDGITWSTSTLPVYGDWGSVCYGEGMFVATTKTNGLVAYSKDGSKWNSVTVPSSLDLRHICFGNHRFVAVSYTENKALCSDSLYRKITQ